MKIIRYIFHIMFTIGWLLSAVFIPVWATDTGNDMGTAFVTWLVVGIGYWLVTSILFKDIPNATKALNENRKRKKVLKQIDNLNIDEKHRDQILAEVLAKELLK